MLAGCVYPAFCPYRKAKQNRIEQNRTSVSWSCSAVWILNMKFLKLPKKSEFPAVVMIPTTITVLLTPEQMESEPLHFRSAGRTWTWLWVDLRWGGRVLAWQAPSPWFHSRRSITPGVIVRAYNPRYSHATIIPALGK